MASSYAAANGVSDVSKHYPGSHRLCAVLADAARLPAKLDLSHLTDVHLPAAEGEKDQQGGTENKSTTAFDRLVLEEWHRPTILALIAQHFRDKKSTVGQREEFDIVKGKGTSALARLRVAAGMISRLTWACRKGLDFAAPWRPRSGQDVYGWFVLLPLQSTPPHANRRL